MDYKPTLLTEKSVYNIHQENAVAMAEVLLQYTPQGFC